MTDRPLLSELLDVRPDGADRFVSTLQFDEPWPVYGGQIAAQALLAAAATVPDGRLPHSLHGYFLRGGDSAAVTSYDVDRDRDGRSFSARRVTARQAGDVIFTASLSFHVSEPGPDVHLEALPADASAPQESRWSPVPRLSAIEWIPEREFDGMRLWPSRYWARLADPVDDDPVTLAAALTYASDISCAYDLLGETGGWPGSSVDHAIWFHRPLTVDQPWLLDLTSPTVAGGRGWYRGSIYDLDGRLVASIAQETLYRPPR